MGVSAARRVAPAAAALCARQARCESVTPPRLIERQSYPRPPSLFLHQQRCEATISAAASHRSGTDKTVSRGLSSIRGEGDGTGCCTAVPHQKADHLSKGFGIGHLAGAAVLTIALFMAPSGGLAMEGYSVRSYAEDQNEAAAFSNIPGQLAGSDESTGPKRISSLLEGKNKEAIRKCSGKCIATCIRGGNGPGLGPASMRKDPVVFKEGFRSRNYCISECTQVCALEINGSDAKK